MLKEFSVFLICHGCEWGVDVQSRYGTDEERREIQNVQNELGKYRGILLYRPRFVICNTVMN